MQGRRLPDGKNYTSPMVHGDYQKVVMDDEFDQGVVWFCCPPRGAVGALRDHQVTEHQDGTITVSPSILLESNDPRQQWHGYLERGVWREV